jgi:hypothetical protein
VTRAGNLRVRINKTDIESAEKTVVVYITGYTAAADGDADTTSTKIDFAFTAAVTGLTANDITITNGTGTVTKGTLSGSGTDWSLGISNVEVAGQGATAGTVKVRINKAGIEGAEKEVTVHKRLNYTDEVEVGYTAGNSSGLTMDTPNDAGSGITTIAMEATEAGEVYFGIRKTTSQSITLGGTDSDKVIVYTDGTVIDGDTSSGIWAVVVVKTGMLPFTGGTPDFYLTVSEPGKLNRIVDVNMEIKTFKTGAAVFKVIRTAGQTYANGDDNVTLVRVDTGANVCTNLAGALLLFENNAEANTEYIVRVENDDATLVKYIFAFNNAENVTLRLMGSKRDGDGENWTRALKHSGATAGTRVNVKNLSTYGEAFFQIGNYTMTGPKRTLVLDRNITLEGNGTTQSTRYNALINVGVNATLALRPGATITKYYAIEKDAGWSPILVTAANDNPNRDPELHGRVRLEGGSITNCTFDNVLPDPNYLGYTAGNLIAFDMLENRYTVGSFYKAAGVVLSGNVNLQGQSANEVTIAASYGYAHGRVVYVLTDEEMSLPAE